MKKELQKNLKRIIFSMLLLGMVLVAAEIMLRVFMPYQLSPIGAIDSANARWYGYGFNPHP